MGKDRGASVGLGMHPHFARRGTRKRQGLLAIGGLMFLAAGSPLSSRAQERKSESAIASELELQNWSRVGASAPELRAVLLKDAGLMVALKRWVAKESTEQGQVVSDSDLTDDGIF